MPKVAGIGAIVHLCGEVEVFVRIEDFDGRAVFRRAPPGLGFWFRVQGFEFRVSGFGFRVSCLEFRV